jgi:hypothetical protein
LEMMRSAILESPERAEEFAPGLNRELLG